MCWIILISFLCLNTGWIYNYLPVFYIASDMLCDGWSGDVYSSDSLSGYSLSIMRLVLSHLVWGSEKNLVLKMLCDLTSLISLVYFSSDRLLTLYTCFELSTAPVLLAVTVWGSQPEKLSARYYMIVYTGVFSLPFLVNVVLVDGFNGRVHCTSLYLYCVYTMFFVKIPVYFFHMWLPKAHVEAPTSGSVVLAGLLLKVGLYGLFKVAVLTGATLHTASVCCVIGMVLSPVLSMFSRDSKKLLAYSRVSHINLVVYGVNILSSMTMSGGTLVGLGHGYISAGLFYLAGTLYTNRGTRQVYYLLGISSSCGMVAGCFSALSIANGGIPPFMSF